MSFLNSKVALVTGGASGIGFAIVKKLLQNGIKGVGLVDISDEGENIVKNLQAKYFDRVIFIKADVSKQQELEDAFGKTINKFKNLDIVVNNAGIANECQWEQMIAVNLEAVIRGTYLAKDKYFPKYKSGQEGIIINTASVLGLFGIQTAPVYCATKHGVIGLGKALGAQKNSNNIKIITICPGPVTTPLLKEASTVLQDSQFLWEKKSAPDFVAESTVKLMQQAEHGSVWIIENEEPPYEIEFPNKSMLRKGSCG